MRHLGLKIRMAVVGVIPAAFYLVAVAVMAVVFGQEILPIAVAGSLLLIGFQYKIGRRATLRDVSVEDLLETQYAQVHQFIEQVHDEKDMKKPSLKIVSMGVSSTLTVDRRGSGTVVIFRELVQLFDRDKLEGIVARRLAHIDNRDVITMQLGQGITSMITIIVQHVVFFTSDNDLMDFFLAIAVGQIVQSLMMIFVPVIPWYREYVADADTKHVINSGDPPARTLEKIQQGSRQACESVRTAQRSHGCTRRDRRRDANVDQQVNAFCTSGPGRDSLRRIVPTHSPMGKRIERSCSQTSGLCELPAIVLGVLLGTELLAVSCMALRLSVSVGPACCCRDDYGIDDTTPDRWTWIICGSGVASLAVAAPIAYQTYT